MLRHSREWRYYLPGCRLGWVTYDVAIIGGGPAGSVCGAFCAMHGLRTLILERERFPREKVCGDCINPSCWPVLRRLEVDQTVRALPHSALDCVEFISLYNESVRVELPRGPNAEIAIKRSAFDSLLLARAGELGADVREGNTLTEIHKEDHLWQLAFGDHNLANARFLVGADGRNSTVARLLGLLPRVTKERVALQAHVPLPKSFGKRVVLQLLPGGYSGQAPVSETELNVCLVGRASTLPKLRKWAARHFALPPEQHWRTITPLTRRSISPAHRGLFLVGDAARVVEPFTGEGISYALSSGEIAAEILRRISQGTSFSMAMQQCRRAHRSLYRGRLWINGLARAAVVAPKLGSILFEIARFQPALLKLLTRKIVE